MSRSKLIRGDGRNSCEHCGKALAWLPTGFNPSTGYYKCQHCGWQSGHLKTFEISRDPAARPGAFGKRGS